MPLSERRAQILQFIIDDYVESAQPVGSKALISRHELPLSSATVRNEMAALEAEGLITHPHTSAGRVPSVEGYRYYVSSLMSDRDLTRDEQMMILHQFHQSARHLQDWIALSASILAHSLHSIGLATEPRVSSTRLKHIQLVEVAETRALLIAVTDDAQVHQRTLQFDGPRSQEALTALAAEFNAAFGGSTLEQLPVGDGDDAPGGDLALAVEAVREILSRESGSLAEIPIIEGVRELLRQPEYDDSDRVLDTLEAIEERRLQDAMPSMQMSPAGDVAIVIGDDSGEGPYSNMSFVLSRYGAEDGLSGTIGILGPTRLPYGDAVSHIRYVRDLLSELLRQFYGEG